MSDNTAVTASGEKYYIVIAKRKLVETLPMDKNNIQDIIKDISNKKTYTYESMEYYNINDDVYNKLFQDKTVNLNNFTLYEEYYKSYLNSELQKKPCPYIINDNLTKKAINIVFLVKNKDNKNESIFFKEYTDTDKTKLEKEIKETYLKGKNGKELIVNLEFNQNFYKPEEKVGGKPPLSKPNNKTQKNHAHKASGKS